MAKAKADKEPVDELNTTAHWVKEFASAKKWFQKYHALVRKIEKTYLLESEDSDSEDSAPAKYNLFWSNVQTILSALYGRMPKVEVDRTNLDPQDDVARVAGLMLERIFNFETNNLEDSPYYTYQENVLDRLVAGMGINWARYSFTEDKKVLPIPEGSIPGTEPVEIPIITDEMAPIDYVNWEDLLYSPCKRWQDKRWVARRVPMCKEEATKRFDKKVAEKIPYTLKSKTGSNEDPVKASVENQADIWEIWNLSNKCVYWYCVGYDELLDHKVDPLQLRGFWPCSRPLMATVLPKKFLPRPDFLYARSQYAELNLVVSRCQLLTEALKVIGVFDKTSEGLQRMLNQANMNQMIPVDNWAMFAEKGGIKGVIDWFPLEMVVNTLEKLIQRKATLIGEVYEILGISDIQRGMASTRETATTQRLKAQYGSARSDKTQNEVARFVTDSTRLRAEIICKHWQPETILERSQIEKTPDKQHAQAAIALLKSDPSVIMRLTVSADNISAPDWDLEKKQRIDFLQAMSQFMGMMMPLIKESPGTGPYMIQIIQWAATGFKGAKQIEGVFDQAYQAMLKNLQTPKPPKPPTPAEQKDLAAAGKSLADAKNKNVETILMLMQTLGVDPSMLGQVPPSPADKPLIGGGQPPAPGQGTPPGGAVPPTSIPPNPAVPGPQVAQPPNPGGPSG